MPRIFSGVLWPSRRMTGHERNQQFFGRGRRRGCRDCPVHGTRKFAAWRQFGPVPNPHALAHRPSVCCHHHHYGRLMASRLRTAPIQPIGEYPFPPSPEGDRDAEGAKAFHPRPIHTKRLKSITMLQSKAIVIESGTRNSGSLRGFSSRVPLCTFGIDHMP